MIYPTFPRVALHIGVVVAVLAGLWFVHRDGFQRGSSSVQAEWDAETIRLEQQARKSEQDARDREAALQATADKLLKDARIENSRLIARNRDLVISLRDRETRPADVGSMPEGSGLKLARCTGQGLYRDDAEFLVGLARDADETRNALNQCVRAYESIQRSAAE